MTGFGRGSAANASKKITIDIKSLNSKQLDLSMRVPSFLREAEIGMRNTVASALLRGKIDLSCSVDYLEAETPASVNTSVLAAYKEQIEAMDSELNISEPADWHSVLLRLPDAMKTESKQMSPADSGTLAEALELAIERITEFRRQEGAKLEVFFREKISCLRSLLEEVAPFEAERVPRIKARLEQELAKLEGIDYDRGRLEQELIFYIEKLDVTEEKTRLTAHLNYFEETLSEPEPGQGKKLGFISQEIGREINTLGSKSNNADMQRIVVRMKDELEQIKEQVLNVL